MHHLLGDGVCDDVANRQWCDFDGGDCCSETADKSSCYECECKSPTTTMPHCK